MKKIAIIVDHSPSEGGTVQYNQAIVDAFSQLPSEKFELLILYTNDFWKDYLKNYPCQLHRVHLTSKLKRIVKVLTIFNFSAKIRKILLGLISPQVARSLNDESIDLLIFPSQDTISLFSSATKVNVIHDLMHRYEPHFPEVSDNGRGAYRDKLFQTMCTESKAIIVDSKVGISQVHESYLIDKGKIFDLPYIPPPHILSEEQIPRDFDEKYVNLPDKFLFYPGQFWQHKNHRRLLEAVKKLNEKEVRVNLVFAGKKDYEYKNIIHFIDENQLKGQITFLDFVPNEYLKGIYSKASGLIMPTFFGPTNIPPLEAIYLNCPVAVSEIYGMPEQLGNASLYFNPKDVNGIAEKMEMLWSNDAVRETLIENGKKLTERWNKDSFNERFKAIISTILA